MEIKCSHSDVVEVNQLVEHPRNPNRHPQRQIEMLAKIIKYQGWRHPVIVSRRSGFVVAGHGRIAAARHLGLETVPVEFQDFENEAQEYAFLIADNKIAELAEHDDAMMVDAIKEFDFEDFELLGLSDLSFLDLGEASYEMSDEVKDEKGLSFKIEVTFKNDMDMNQVKDDLLSQGYIVKVL